MTSPENSTRPVSTPSPGGSDPTVAAFDLARFHMRSSIAAKRRGEHAAALMWSRTAASYAARARALGVAS